MTLEELLAEVGKHDAKTVAAALQAHLQPVYTQVFNAGHMKATADAKTKRKELEDRVAELEGENTTLTEQATELRNKTPDVKKVQDDHLAEVQRLKAKHKAELEAAAAKLKSTVVAVATRDLRQALVNQGLDPDYADVLVSKPDVVARIRPSEDGSGVTVLQAGTELPLAPGDGQTAVGLLAGELRKTAPAKWVVSDADRGAGTQAAGTGGKGGTGKSADGRVDYAKLRAEAKAEQQKATVPSHGSAADRLAGVRPPAQQATT